MTALQWLLNNRGQSKLQLLYLTNSVTTMQIWLKLHFAEFYSNCDMPSIKFSISVPVVVINIFACSIVWKWIQLSSVRVSADYFPAPRHRTTDSNRLMSISSMKKNLCVLLNEHLHSCSHTSLLRLSCSRCLSLCLKTIQMSPSCSALLWGEKKTKAAWRGTHGLFRDYYSEEKYMETFHTSPKFLPLPFCPFFLT